MSDLVTVTQPTASVIVPAGEQVLSQATRENIKNRLAESTRRGYAGIVTAWEAYAAATGTAAYPADPIAVGNWLSQLAEDGASGGRRKHAGKKVGQAVATLRKAVAAVRWAHLSKGLDFNTGHIAIAENLVGIARTRAEAQAQAEALTAGMLSEIVAHLDGGLLQLRDAALLAVGYSFALRRSELTGLNWAEEGVDDGRRSGVLRVTADRIIVTLTRHKTMMKTGGPDEIIVPREGNDVLFDTLQSWVQAAKIRRGEPLLRPVHKTDKVMPDRFDDSGVNKIIRKRVRQHFERAGHEPHVARQMAGGFSGHSLRVGFAVAAANGGAGILEIARITRHRSPTMVARYVAQADAMRENPHRRAGVSLTTVAQKPEGE